MGPAAPLGGNSAMGSRSCRSLPDGTRLVPAFLPFSSISINITSLIRPMEWLRTMQNDFPRGRSGRRGTLAPAPRAVNLSLRSLGEARFGGVCPRTPSKFPWSGSLESSGSLLVVEVCSFFSFFFFPSKEEFID